MVNCHEQANDTFLMIEAVAGSGGAKPRVGETNRLTFQNREDKTVPIEIRFSPRA